MSAEYAPAAILALFAAADAAAPGLGLANGGVLGDSAHTYGYHRARAVLPPDDYSVLLPRDRAGDPWAAAALDLTPATVSAQILLSTRLAAATEARDPRLVSCVREWFGSVNGRSVTGRDVATGRVVASDDSHLWHVHLSFYRDTATDPDSLAPLAGVLAGVPLQRGLTVTPEEAAQIRAMVREEIHAEILYLTSLDDNWRDGPAHSIAQVVRAELRAALPDLAAVTAAAVKSATTRAAQAPKSATAKASPGQV